MEDRQRRRSSSLGQAVPALEVCIRWEICNGNLPNWWAVVVLQEWMVLEDWKCYYWALECGILVGMVLKYTVS